MSAAAYAVAPSLVDETKLLMLRAIRAELIRLYNTQARACVALGVEQQYLNKVWQLRTDRFSVHRLLRWCEMLGVDVRVSVSTP